MQRLVRLFSVVLFCGSVLNWAGEGKASPRIIDGTLVPQSTFPTVGQVGSIGDLDFCTGTLIAPRFVLMAAHCVNNQSAGSFAFGQTEGVFVLGGKTYKTRHVYVHPTYVGDDSQEEEGAVDLAIFELDTEVKGVTPSPLYRKVPTVGTVLTLAGYGLLGTGTSGVGQDLPPKGMISTGKSPIDVVTSTFIEWNFNNVPPPNQESNTAPGDSGGPQFITENNVMYVASVTSGGEKNDASFGDFSYNTRVDIATAWIDSITGGTAVAGNHDPVISSFTASNTGFLAGTTVTFTATASDPDNNPLHYHWLFGDGDEVLDGPTSLTHTFSAEGNYVVQVVVTDQKGGSAGASQNVLAISSTPLTPALTASTFTKKVFTLDFSDKASGGSIELIVQNSALKFSDSASFAAAFPEKGTVTTVYIGTSDLASFFGTSGKSKTDSFKFDPKKGTIQVKVSQSQTLLPLMDFFGASNADISKSVTVPISLKVHAGLSIGAPTYRFGGDATFAYVAKKNKGGKGK